MLFWRQYITSAKYFSVAKVHETHKRNYNYADVRVISHFWLIQSNPHYIIFLHSFIHLSIHYSSCESVYN